VLLTVDTVPEEAVKLVALGSYNFFPFTIADTFGTPLG
jgi:hypothetical protein